MVVLLNLLTVPPWHLRTVPLMSAYVAMMSHYEVLSFAYIVIGLTWAIHTIFPGPAVLILARFKLSVFIISPIIAN
jgi:hypothetical protein